MTEQDRETLLRIAERLERNDLYALTAAEELRALASRPPEGTVAKACIAIDQNGEYIIMGGSPAAMGGDVEEIVKQLAGESPDAGKVAVHWIDVPIPQTQTVEGQVRT